MARKSPLDKVLGKLEDLDEVNLSNLVQRLARERKLLETVFLMSLGTDSGIGL